MSVPETEGSKAYLLQLALIQEAMVDLDLANISQGEKEILAIKLVDIRWEEQQQC